MRAMQPLGWAKPTGPAFRRPDDRLRVPTASRSAWARFALPTLRMALTTAVLAIVSLHPAAAESVEEFYRGKTVIVAIGFSVGGGYDLYARLLALHLGKHIPGHPNVVAQ